MKTASIRDLHIRTSELVREAAKGEVIYIQRRGEDRGRIAAGRQGLAGYDGVLGEIPANPER